VRSSVSVAFAALLVCGCVSTPGFDDVSGVTPKSIVDVIECELITARDRKDRRFQGLAGWYAVAELSLQVDEQATLTPAFTHTNVVSKSLTQIFDWGVKFDTQSQRTYTQSITFKIGDLQGPCDRAPGGVSLNGNLGLQDVLEMAATSIDSKGDKGIGYSTDVSSGRDTTGFGTSDSDKKFAPTDFFKEKSESKKEPPVEFFNGQRRGRPGAKAGGGGGGRKKDDNAFGTTIEFTVIRGINATGPTWTLSHFKGPGKMFSTQRNDTHNVTISFARSAEKAAIQNVITNQRSLPNSIINRLRTQ
jgi:hypothetical protein